MNALSPMRAVIVGAGHRSEWYAKYSLKHPDELQIAGVADPNPIRRDAFRSMFGFPEENCFDTAEALARAPKFADAAINGTMDDMHVQTSLPLLRAGYDLLIEKPFAINEAELWELYRAQQQTGGRVMICHVLRYAPFYQAVRSEIASGALGEIISIEQSEYVSYHHMATCYVRGKWSNFKACKAGMLLAKSCHDLDLMMWLKGGAPKSIASFGGRFLFRPEKAPKGAADRCMDCPVECACDYSAIKMYIDHPERWRFYVWTELEGKPDATIEDKIALLKGGSPFGRCVYACDNDCVDHQTVSIEFMDGATGSFNMIGASGKDERTLHIVGTRAELYGSFEDGVYTVRSIDARPGAECSIRQVYPNEGLNAMGHGGGDHRLINDFVRYVRGEAVSPSLTSLEDSIYGHLAVFLAEKSRETGEIQHFPAI